MREDGSKLWLLVGLSFAYGIFHAAGPGHGKAVISSYMLANEVALRRGIMLSFVSAFLQALTAIVVMTLVFLVLRGTAVSMTDATWFLEVVELCADHGFRRLAAVAEGRPAARRPVRRQPGAQPVGRARPFAWPCPWHSRTHHARALTTTRRMRTTTHATRMPCRTTTPRSMACTRTMIRRTHAAHSHHDHAHHDHAGTATPRARSARPAAIRTRRIRRCCRATASTGARHGRRSPPSASAPAPAR